MTSPLMDMTRELADDFVLFKLGKGRPANTISLSARTLRRIAAELEKTHGDLFANMIKTIDCCSDAISVTFVEIAENMFADKVINWGRIAVLFTFAGNLALYCDRHDLEEDTKLVVLWLTEFVNRRLLKWIQNNGGWDSFNEHFKERKGDKGVWWSDVLCTVGLVAGAAGAALVFAR